LGLEVIFADEAEEATAFGAGLVEIADGFFFFGVFGSDKMAAFVFDDEDSAGFEFGDEVGIMWEFNVTGLMVEMKCPLTIQQCFF
jgi:hypothetical protein